MYSKPCRSNGFHSIFFTPYTTVSLVQRGESSKSGFEEAGG